MKLESVYTLGDLNLSENSSKINHGMPIYFIAAVLCILVYNTVEQIVIIHTPALRSERKISYYIRGIYNDAYVTLGINKDLWER
jgi:hypothetical protein